MPLFMCQWKLKDAMASNALTMFASMDEKMDAADAGDSTPRAAAASALCVPRRPARPVPKLTSLASGRGRM